MGVAEYDSDRRVAQLETKVESALAIDARLRALEGDLKALKPKSGVREWLQALGPYVTGVIVLLVGYAVKDSVTLAMEREKLDLTYVTQMRDLVKDFDKAAESGDAGANADAVALAMFGPHAILPLVARLESGATANIAAERGLTFIGANDPKNACPRYVQIMNDRAQRFGTSTHLSIVTVLWRASCLGALPDLERYAVELQGLEQDAKRREAFASRFAEPKAVDIDYIKALTEATAAALTSLKAQGSRP